MTLCICVGLTWPAVCSSFWLSFPFMCKIAGRKTGLKLNAKKTKIIHIKGKDGQNEDLTAVNVDGAVLEKVTHFKYLGSIKTEDGSCLQYIKARIAMAKQKMIQLNNIWKDRGIPNFL